MEPGSDRIYLWELAAYQKLLVRQAHCTRRFPVPNCLLEELSKCRRLLYSVFRPLLVETSSFTTGAPWPGSRFRQLLAVEMT
jgi:hypothetical protein